MQEAAIKISKPVSSDSRLASLDGFRAIAVLTTIYHHSLQRYGIHTHNPIFAALNVSGDGVAIFFVLSGYLITTLMLREREKSGSVSLKDFYIRRIFRIFPPFYAYLAFFIIFCIFDGTQIDWPSLYSAAFFFLDYPTHTPFWAYEHTWSLSVEQQFYILWPIILLASLRFGNRLIAAKIAMALIVITPVLRVLTTLMHSPMFYHRQSLMLHTRMDALMCGCLLALLVGMPAFENLYSRAAKWWWIMPIYMFFLNGLLRVTIGMSYTNSIGMTINSICIAFFVLWCVRNANSIAGKILNHPVMVTIGVWSYGMYLWQTFFINYDVNANVPTFFALYPVKLALIFLVAWLSHILLEKPSLKLRQFFFGGKKISKSSKETQSSKTPKDDLALAETSSNTGLS